MHDQKVCCVSGEQKEICSTLMEDGTGCESFMMTSSGSRYNQTILPELREGVTVFFFFLPSFVQMQIYRV